MSMLSFKLLLWFGVAALASLAAVVIVLAEICSVVPVEGRASGLHSLLWPL